MAIEVHQHYTAEEYLALERKATYKSEHINGQIYAMSGASREHNFIAGDSYSELLTQLRGKPCDVYLLDLRVKVSPTGMYTYPDVVVTCGESRFEDAEVDTLLNPTVIIEVLSPSTERYDRGDKFAHYQELESLRDYVLISQDKMRVEHYVRLGESGDRWELTAINDPEGVLHIESVGCDVALRDIYRRVEFPSSEAASSAPSESE